MDIFAFICVLGVIALLLDIWAIASVWRTTKTKITKLIWALTIFILPFIGIAIWGLVGPRGVAEPPTSPSHSKG